jgi:hypothetical protein
LNGHVPSFAFVLFALATLAIYTGALVAVLWLMVTRELRALRADAARHAMLATFGPAQAAVQADPTQLVTWYPLAQAARRADPATFAALDAAAGATFPFPRALVERAHARVSSDWLAWEQAHDEEYRVKAGAAEQELGRAVGDSASLARARLERIQHEKIERYQQRYEVYIRTSKALQALLE